MTRWHDYYSQDMKEMFYDLEEMDREEKRKKAQAEFDAKRHRMIDISTGQPRGFPPNRNER